MSGVLRKLRSLRNLIFRRKPGPDAVTEEKWAADFGRQKHVRFDIKSESSYDANLRKNLFYSGHSLVLGLKKNGLIAWTEAPEYRYRDFVASGTIRVDARGGYGAGGMLFRMVDEKTYYSFLISSKGYFRLDALRNGMPFPLAGWTELPLSAGAVLGADQQVDFSIAAYGSHIVVLIQGRWAAEFNDSSAAEGTLCFAAASYDEGDPAYMVIRETKGGDGAVYTAEVFLEALTVDSRILEVSAFYEKWHDSPEAGAPARLNLAETFTAMEQYSAAMVQLRKSWDMPGHRKTQRELLLAGRLARALGLMADAEAYTGQCFELNLESAEGKEALSDMAKIISMGDRFAELKNFCSEAVKVKPEDSLLWNFKGHAHWNLNEYEDAALSYDSAFERDRENGIFAKNAANVYDVMGRKKEALSRYLEAGRAFLNEGNYNDLGLLIPRFLSLGAENREARSLAGKWAFAVEDWEMADAEFREAEKLRKAKRPRPPKDGAQVFLEALLLIRSGRRGEALPLLEETVLLEKNYALFHFRLAENLFLLNDDPGDPRTRKELDTALALSAKEEPGEKSAREITGLAGWINNFAAQVSLREGNLDSAEKYLGKAVKILGDLPAVQVNRGVLFYLRGFTDKSMEILDAPRRDDPEGIMANCAGNLLVREERFEEADEKYRRALAAAPDNVEYLRNRASCLIKLGLYGEADELLARAHTLTPDPEILEMISYVAAKKGEYARAEQACLSALEMNPRHAPSLLSLGWVLITLGRREEARDILRRLDKLELKEAGAGGREELRARLDDLVNRTVECALCDRSWKIPREPPPVPAIRLFAMPPDDLPAGSCAECGKTYCIGCAKKNIDTSGRFICSSCGQPLKLGNDGLKKIIRDWASGDGLIKGGKGKRASSSTKHPSGAGTSPEEKRGRPKKSGKSAEAVPETSPALSSGKKRGRGRPKKITDGVLLKDKDTAGSGEPVKREPGRPRKNGSAETVREKEAAVPSPEKRTPRGPRKPEA